MKTVFVDEIEKAFSKFATGNVTTQRFSKLIADVIEESESPEHDKLSQPLSGCFCDACCEKRYSEKETVKTKLHRNEGF